MKTSSQPFIDGSGIDNVVTVMADYVDVSGFKVIHGAEIGIYLNSAIGVTIEENSILSTHYGICLQNSHKNTIGTNIISQNFLNIIMTDSSDNVFLNNVLEDSRGQSLWMSSSTNNYFDNNKIRGTNGFSGLYINNCTNNLFRRNEVCFSQVWGMYLAFYSTGNVFSENTFSNNIHDFLIHHCAYNTFYHNNFFSASESDNQDCISTWDDGYLSGGNYWSDYNTTDADGDGIGDTPYTISTSYSLDTYYDYGPDQDFYPLMSPYEIISLPDPETLIISPENKTYTVNSVALTLSANELTSGTTYKIDGQLGLAAGNTTLNWLSNGKHILTTYAADLNGKLVPSERVYFTVDAAVNEPKPPNERIYDYDLPPIIPSDPVIKILSPIQDETYNTNNIVFNFTVTEPEEYSELKTRISYIRYALDPSPYSALLMNANWIEVPIASGTEKTKLYSVRLSGISEGPHSVMLIVDALCTEVPRYGVVVSEDVRVYFDVKTTENSDLSSLSTSNTSQPTATPSPTPQSTPTSNPTPSPAPPSIPQKTETQPESKLNPTAPVASAASIIAIGVGLFVYFKRRKHKTGTAEV